MHFEIAACIKRVIIEALMDVDDAHTHTTDPPLTTQSLARATERDLAGLLCMTRARARERETLRGGFRLMSPRLHHRFSCFCGVFQSSLSTNTRLTNVRGNLHWRGFEGDAAALVQMRVQLRRKMDRPTVDENGPLRL